jgi:hypothetical protein
MLLRVIVLLVVIGITWSLLYIKPNAKKILQRPFLSDAYLDVELKYQVITLLLAFLTLALVFIVAPTSFQKYFAFGNISAEVVPVPAIGLSPSTNETWLQIGINFAVVISVVTFIFIYFQLIKGNRIQKQGLRFFYWIIIFALTNSFTEEMITRFSIVALLDNLIPLSYIYLVSAFVFGSVHYFGTPGKIPGVLLAGFLGWFLAKSIGETHGFFWAWLIHFLQDVVIITGLFFQQFAHDNKNG